MAFFFCSFGCCCFFFHARAGQRREMLAWRTKLSSLEFSLAATRFSFFVKELLLRLNNLWAWTLDWAKKSKMIEGRFPRWCVSSV
jgi:hypothetical protein